MSKTSIINLFIVVLVALTGGCRVKSSQQATSGVAGPRVIVYKTSNNYYLHVPVTLSDDKQTVVSFPAPSDLYYNGELAYPLKLENGYLLDRRGIGKNCAFLKWTYYEYSRLSYTPAQEEFMKMMLDTDPVTEMYDCGRKSSYKDLESELNQIIREGKLDQFDRVK